MDPTFVNTSKTSIIIIILLYSYYIFYTITYYVWIRNRETLSNRETFRYSTELKN